jgi:hypothetical protein
MPIAAVVHDRAAMTERAPRYVPLVSGVVALAFAVALLALWKTPAGIFYWVRGLIFGLLAWYGLWNLKVAAFASDDQVRRAVSGDVEVWKERDVAAPSAFDLRDVAFLIASVGALFVFLLMFSFTIGLL